jgi:NitT/TauT family transport system ATP-binding protein
MKQLKVEKVDVDELEAGSPVLEVRELSKAYGPRIVLDRLDMNVRRGNFLCIVGQSGTGKTTLLRCMSGLTAPSSGQVLLNGDLIDRPPAGLAVVFQDYSRSLMPWMSVLSNVELPLRARGLKRAQRVERAQRALAAVGLDGHGAKYPWQMSGGMQQRAAIARALAYQPEAMLMDEPFASVDAQTRAELENLMLAVREEFGMTIVLVTHDIDEAVYLGDEVVILSGSPARVRKRIRTDLGTARDQLLTKADPRFVELRSEVLSLIREGSIPGAASASIRHGGSPRTESAQSS